MEGISDQLNASATSETTQTYRQRHHSPTLILKQGEYDEDDYDGQMMSGDPFDNYQKARMNFVQTVADLSSRSQNIEYLENAGALELLRPLLSDVVPPIQQTAAVALGRMANYDGKIAQAIVRKDILPQLLQSINKQNKFYKKAALFVLRAISKHSPEMAQVTVQSGGLEAMVVCLEDFDPGVKEAAAWALGYVGRHNRNLGQARQVLAALASIAKHSVELAESVVEAEIFPDVLIHLAHPDDLVKRNAATIVREGVIQLAIVLDEETEDHVLAANVWALGQIGKHSPEHAKSLAMSNIFDKIIELYSSNTCSEDLKQKCMLTLKMALQKCLYLGALEPLLDKAPPNVMKYVVGQFSKILPNDPKARRLFVTSGGLQKLQEIRAEPGTTLMEYITIINCCFPEELVRYKMNTSFKKKYKRMGYC
ncbi:Sperm-associated antigen 6 [Blattella germanica]|nr:Sperm-associated antigen 6 [Blattella germanica]